MKELKITIEGKTASGKSVISDKIIMLFQKDYDVLSINQTDELPHTVLEIKYKDKE